MGGCPGLRLHRLPEHQSAALNPSSHLSARSAVLIASVVIALLFAVFRWHAITFNDDIMVDESMFLVDAMRANDAGYTPWLKFDNLTSGPLNSLPVALLLRAGFPANHILLHGFAAFLQALGFILVLLVSVKLAGHAQGIVVGVGAALVFAFQQAPDFTHYSSGCVPFALLAGGWLVALKPLEAAFAGTSLPRLFAGFLLFAMAPLAKTQAAVPGFVCCVGLAFLFLWQEFRAGAVWRRVATGFCLMLAGGVLPLAVAAWFVWCADAMPYALGSVAAVGGYAGQINFFKTFKDALFLVLNADSRFLFAAVVPSAVALACYSALSNGPRAEMRSACGQFILLLAMVGWLVSALFAAAVPQTMAGIYEVFLYAPGVLALAALAGWLRVLFTGSDLLKAVLLGGCFAAASFPLLGPALKKNFASSGKSHSALPMDAEHRVSRALESLKKPEDKLFVWGWAPAIYIHAAMPPASRFSQAHLCTERFYPGPLFRDALMDDLVESRPRFIVDAMQSGFGMNQLGTWIGFYEPSRDLSAQEFYPRLVEMGYAPVADVPLKDGSKALIYELRQPKQAKEER